MQPQHKKIGLLFGSFNPVHIGHLVLANYFLEFTDIDELQLVLSPQNPLKPANELASEQHRLAMLRIALASYPLPIDICEVELHMPKPSYTISTLRQLQSLHPDSKFVVLMGADSLAGIERWREYEAILSGYEVYVYPRPNFDVQQLCSAYGATYVPAPLVDISSTFIRQSIQQGYNVCTMLPYGVAGYIEENKLYRQ